MALEDVPTWEAKCRDLTIKAPIICQESLGGFTILHLEKTEKFALVRLKVLHDP